MLAFDARRNEVLHMNSEIPQISNCIKFSFQLKNVDSTCATVTVSVSTAEFSLLPHKQQ